MMKGFFSSLILMFSVFTVFPMFILLFEHMLVGRDSLLQKLLNNISDDY